MLIFTPPVGPSQDSSGVNIVDAILVYGQAKSAFGWPEGPGDTLLPAKSPASGGPGQSTATGGERGEEEEEEEVEAGESMAAIPLTHLGR